MLRNKNTCKKKNLSKFKNLSRYLINIPNDRRTIEEEVVLKDGRGKTFFGLKKRQNKF